MALRNILEDGDPILRKKSRPVGEVTDRTRMILDDMIETMHDAEGAGLAAPQVGILRRMFVAEPERGGEIYCMVDPEIIESEGVQESEEGCLSLPGYAGVVDRPEKIRMKALDRNGEPHEYTFEGFPATVMSHEYDHLDGILYKDKAKEMFRLDEMPEEDGKSEE